MKLHNVQKIDFEGPNLVLAVDGQVYRIDLASVSERLARAGNTARRSYSISPSGYGIHWPEVDEDLTIDGLIGWQPKTDETNSLLKEKPGGKASLYQHLRRVIEHVQTTQGQFCELMENGLKTMPIPFFGDIEEAEILTIGVNPAAGEFKNRNWPESEATAEYLEPRLRNYFLSDPPYPDPYTWFLPWEKSLDILNDCSRRRVTAAHLDLSPRATRAMSNLPVEAFLKMVKADLEIFFETLLFCKHAKVLLLAGSVPSVNPSVNKKYQDLNEFLRDSSPSFGFELKGPEGSQPNRGKGSTCRDMLISQKLDRQLPVFFFSHSPSHQNKEDVVCLVERRKVDICRYLNDL